MKTTFYFILFVLLISCKQKPGADFSLEIHKQWQKTRLERLKSATGWINLAGLYWLNEGVNTLGSDTSNTLVFPKKAPPFVGEISRIDSMIHFQHVLGDDLTINDMPIANKDLQTDATGDADLIKHGDFGWYIIKRGNKYGIRLRDYKSPLIEILDSIPAYAFSKEWIVEASYEPLDTPLVVTVPTVIGVDEEYKASGRLHFNVGKKEYTVLPFDTKGGFFIIFGDATSGVDTYAAGRFLYVQADSKANKVFINFNQAYNPPCAFTPYATCPLPPRENILDLAVTAGEKNVHLYEMKHSAQAK